MQHLHQLGLLARALNRTLVLPNVNKARFGTCRRNPFEFYYEADTLQRLGIKVCLPRKGPWRLASGGWG